jgi:hypothetical protein
MPPTWFMPRRESIAGCAVILLLVTGLFLCSPWHKHARSQVCGFTDLEHGGAIQPSAHPVIAPPVVLSWRPPREVPAFLLAVESFCSLGRAPPAQTHSN